MPYLTKNSVKLLMKCCLLMVSVTAQISHADNGYVVNEGSEGIFFHEICPNKARLIFVKTLQFSIPPRSNIFFLAFIQDLIGCIKKKISLGCIVNFLQIIFFLI